MIKTTKAQRAMLKQKWETQNRGRVMNSRPTITYRAFRKQVTPYFDNTGCIMVPWCGMWLGIETDGYAHT